MARLPGELSEKSDLFALIRKGDILLHHPYDSFGPVLSFLRQAADDPDVLAIKMTLYRTGANAEVVRLLIRAAENHKQVAVSVEIKARFDEENNIAWARALERAGAHVFFGHAELKTHAKAALVVRREGEGLRRYVHLGTGNYNEGTSRLYTDLGLLTADPEFGEDLSEFFNGLSGFSKKARHRKLAVAPTALSDAILAKIDAQAERARAGKPAAIFAKLNALVDVQVIQALYRASGAGVRITLCVRGVCCLRPGIPGVSENIRVMSILGRFLEHERVLVFGPAGEEEFFLSSADWMPRNLHRRVEILFPVESPALREQIRLRGARAGADRQRPRLRHGRRRRLHPPRAGRGRPRRAAPRPRSSPAWCAAPCRSSARPEGAAERPTEELLRSTVDAHQSPGLAPLPLERARRAFSPGCRLPLPAPRYASQGGCLSGGPIAPGGDQVLL